MSDEQSSVRKRLLEIRAISMSALLTQDTQLVMRHYARELHDMKADPSLLPEYFEAKIAVNVAMRRRPARTIFAINRLRRLRTKEDNTPAFDRFEQIIRASLGDLTLTPHGYTDATFASRSHDDVWKLADAQLQRLADAGHQVFLNSGTLLGVTRDKRLIEHDDDLDLALVLKADTEAAAAQEWNELTLSLVDQGIVDLKKTNSSSVLKLQGTGDLNIDLFPCWIEGGKVFVFPYSYGALEAEAFFPLQTCAVTKHQIPAHPDKVLAQNYGPGWATPDPYFKFQWAAAHRKFKQFLGDLNEVA